MLLWTLDHLLSLVELTAERGMHSAAVKGNVGPAAASAPARPACRKTRRGTRRWRVAVGGAAAGLLARDATGRIGRPGRGAAPRPEERRRASGGARRQRPE